MTVLHLETLESLIDVNFEFAQSLFKKEGGIYPMAVGYTRDNTQRVCVVGKFANAKEKQEWAVLVTMLFAYYDVDKYAFMSEGWCVVPEANTSPEDAEKEAHKYGSIENHPNRIEILSLLAINRYDRRAALKQITEDKQLIDFPKGDMRGGLTGTMCELLPPRDMPPEIKHKMKDMIEMFKEKGLVSIEILTK